MENQKRKICFVITSPVHYSRSKLLLDELKKRGDIDLQIVIGGSAILSRYGDITDWLVKDGFEVSNQVIMSLEGGNNVAMAKTTGLGIIEFASVFDSLSPDIIVLRADRYEVLSAAIAGAYLNKTIGHIEGGDVSGSIDESARHAITKLSHLHFVTNEDAKTRVLQMGENPEYVFNFGCPDVEFAILNNCGLDNNDLASFGVGANVDIEKPFLMVIQHPVTTESGKNKEHIHETLKAIISLKMPVFWFWPNIDAGTDEIAAAIRTAREKTDIDNYVHFVKVLPPEKFIALLKKASCLIGNSSSGIKECSVLGVPVVNIGTRQAGRLKGDNVVDVSYDSEEIKLAIQKQLERGHCQNNNLYYQENTSKKIAEKLATCKLYVQKKFYDYEK